MRRVEVLLNRWMVDVPASLQYFPFIFRSRSFMNNNISRKQLWVEDESLQNGSVFPRIGLAQTTHSRPCAAADDQQYQHWGQNASDVSCGWWNGELWFYIFIHNCDTISYHFRTRSRALSLLFWVLFSPEVLTLVLRHLPF